MKILSVATLVSPDGEYGGPVRVALNQLNVLQDRGHDVTLVAGARGFDEMPRTISDVHAELFPVRRFVPRSGFAGLASPELWRFMRKHARDYDVIHVHAARDLITLPAARIAQRASVPTVLQCHGMIDESQHPLHGVFDAAITRPALAHARAVTFLTPVERSSLHVISRGHARLEELRNGVPAAASAADRSKPHILFLARLAARKRPELFVRAAQRLAPAFPSAEFTLIGPDEGEGQAIERMITTGPAADRIRWLGPLSPERTLSAMQSASAYVLPSVDEPYPMAVLEAMSVGLPVIVTDTCGLASIIEESASGIVVDASEGALVAAVRTLLENPMLAARMSENALTTSSREFTMAAIADRLESLYAA